MSTLEKVWLPKLRVALTPKERDEWDRFQEMCASAEGNEEAMLPLLRERLEQLAARGNPAAQRFMEQISIASYTTRKPNEPGKEPPKRAKSSVKVVG